MIRYFNNFIFFWTSATAVAIIALYWIFPLSFQVEFADAALGKETQVIYGFYNGDQVHCYNIGDAEECFKPARNRSLENNVLWLGNSQLHAINQPSPSARPGSVTAAAVLRDHDIELLTFSQPNASLAEHYILFETFLTSYAFDVLLLPIVFDDMREQSIRPDIKEIVNDPTIASLLMKTAIGTKLVQKLSTVKKVEAVSLQERSEALINVSLDACCSWETLRKYARGETSLFIYRLRNYVFGINPSSTRRKIPVAYNQNLAALEAILTMAQEYDIKVILYIPPLRSDVPRPYDQVEYFNFKNDIKKLSASKEVRFVDFEKLVPGPLWGTKESTSLQGGQELDFMHFQEAGHLLLGQSVAKEVLEVINDF